MAKKRKIWIAAPLKRVKHEAPDFVKRILKEKADEIIEKTLKPRHIKPPPADIDLNYLADIYSKWHRNFFYFCATYNSPSPDAISPSFETKFARMEYADNEKFHLSYMRYTGQWWEVHRDLPMPECLQLITEEPLFIP